MDYPFRPPSRPAFSLNRKLTAFISLVIILSCASLSYHLITHYIFAQTQSLHKQGLLLIEHLSRTSRYALISADRIRLKELLDSTLEIKEIVYVVFTDQQGKSILSKTKGRRLPHDSLTRAPEHLLFPPPTLAGSLLRSSDSEPVVTPIEFTHENVRVLFPGNSSNGWIPVSFLDHHSEIVYDLAIPILRNRFSEDQTAIPAPAITASDSKAPPTAEAPLYGVVQIGLSDVYLQQDIRTMIWRVLLITICIIALGIGATGVVAARITKPLNALTLIAGRIMKGDYSQSLPRITEDEIGVLTSTINRMTHVLNERDQAMVIYLEHLKSLGHSGTLIASPTEISAVFSSVIEILTTQLGFTRVVTGLFDSDHRCFLHVHGRGFAKPLPQTVQAPNLVFSHSHDFLSSLLSHVDESLASPFPSETWQREYPLLSMAVTFCVDAPDRGSLSPPPPMTGFLAADRFPVQFAPFDHDILRTLGSHLRIAIDKIFAFQHLEAMNQTLEARVSERTHALETANAKLKELDQLKSTFLSVASHELRTPLTSIKMFVDNMHEGIGGPLSPQQADYLLRIRSNVDRLQRMITNLLDLTQIESGQMRLQIRPVSLSHLFLDVRDHLIPFARNKDISVTLESSPNLPSIQADYDKLFQAMFNLLDNAIKFSSRGGHVTVGIEVVHDDHLEVCVRDTGCGILSRDLDKIFLPFYRSPTSSLYGTGSGLGLALTRHLIELHGGRLWVDSNPSQGSSFHLLLPIQSPLSSSQSKQLEFI